MKNILFMISLLLMTHGQNLFAHGGKHAPITEDKAVEIATTVVNLGYK